MLNGVFKRSVFLVVFIIAAVCISIPVYALNVTPAVKVARVTGATPGGESLPNPNNTPYNATVYATDLGIMWDAGNGTTLTAFGDTFGAGWPGYGGSGDDWRSNFVAKSSDSNLSDGLTFSSYVCDTTRHAKQIIYSAHDTSGNGDMTSIPTAGIYAGGKNYIHYMNVKNWGNPGYWTTNHSKIVYSSDGGNNWNTTSVQWAANSKFAQAAFVKSGGYVYMFGTPAGRFGSCYIARVNENQMETQASYQYWNGSSWVSTESSAVAIVSSPVSELSVQWNSYFSTWIMCYFNPNTNAIVIRTAPSVTGPWSGESVVATSSTYPQLYGGFIHPWTNNGTDLYFTMSQWGPYNVFLMKSTLSSPPPNRVNDPGFENQTSGTVSNPWMASGTCGIDLSGRAHSGSKNAWANAPSGWNNIYQNVSVTANTNYTLTGWINTSSNNTDGYFGVRTTGGSIISERKFGYCNGYTLLTVTFNSGSNTTVQVYAGMWGNGSGTWINVDDVSIQ